MKYVIFFLTLLFFTACTPKYKNTYSYIAPKSPDAQQCVQQCKEELATCKALCKSNFEICAKKAETIGKKNYEAKMKNYYQALEAYARQMEMYNFQRELFWFDDFDYYRNGFGYYGPFGPRLMIGPSPMYSYPRPVKPNLQQEILQAQLKNCRIDCKCIDAYDKCFEACGGKIVQKRVCIKNCPK
ncbi:MAG: hypothetical protein DSZ05_09345 [Sulfurospirillum sp.]|nr:MAG: hypothetical protein DSZ05_09345 [Sulfurospirillum sp.]